VPREDRTNALRWWTRHQEGKGEPWERLFDRRVISDDYSCRSATTIPAGRRGPE